ncbi:SusC/RagA family TonB-linked outer membrane protein [Sphingobacterium faecium]|uniref:SusC/RagA family TonB-linked outer membrane protein n=1 Tax=Sphingobacterium faecium TaxID=34087 RepID=UPI00246939F3|nr:TonB-dependent receptor [Sphingobacterium faecium]MDH5826271.1 TonB-dependent receptor [Sphingobacterium faecium]
MKNKNNQLSPLARKLLLYSGTFLFVGSASASSFLKTNAVLNLGSNRLIEKSKDSSTQQAVTGSIRDSEGKPMSGVTIFAKGRSAALGSSGADGRFSVMIESGATLLFRFIGFNEQEIVVNSQRELQVTMIPSTENLEEVVVVGFGTQKKANLTGSVATVKGDDMIKRPVTNAAAMLQGQVPGLSIVQGSGEPGNEGINIRMRGQGTFSGAGNNPLVLIDGVEGSLGSLNPNDIENVSVLKDAASASIYGSRAANGVILVTTKSGSQGKTVVDYSNNLAIHTPTKLFDLITNSAEYMELWNEAKKNTGVSSGLYPQEAIDQYRNATDRVKYPNTDWLDTFFNPAFVHQHNLGISGGSEKTQYNLSLGYVNQPGVFKGFKYERFNTRLNLTSQVNKWLKIGANLSAKQGNIQRPRGGGEDSFLSAMSQAPTYSPQLPDGRYVFKAYDFEVNNKNMQAIIDNEVFFKNRDYLLNFQGWFDVNLAPGLNWYTKGALNIGLNNESDWRPTIPLYNFVTGDLVTNLDVGASGLSKSRNENRYSNVYSYLKYDRSFNDSHNFGVQVGYSYEANEYQYISAYRQHYYSNILQELDAGGAAVQTNNGSANEWALQSLFGRLTYNYKNKYLVEGNFRYDGSSRFRSDLRWGVFPSFSGAWRVTEESFIKDNDHLKWLNDLKIRGSYGVLGNQNINLNNKPYPYQDLYNFTGDYSFNNAELSTGIAQGTLANRDITWEKTSIYDIGVDMRIFGKLDLTFDWYRKDTRDILRSIQLTDLVGLGAPPINSGEVRNEGVELSLNYRNRINGGFFEGMNYSIGGNIDRFKNKVTKYGSRDIGSWTIKENGQPWDSFYLLETTGIFQTAEQVSTSPKQFNDNTLPGDLIYKDQNGDGIINNDDRILMDGVFPSFQYAVNGSVSWKNFDLSFMFQGVEGRNLFLNNWGIVPFVQGSAPTTDWRNRWTEDNPSTTMPRIYWGWDAPQKFSRPSSYFLRDASYLRLKNLTIGYTIPAEKLSRIGINSLRVFASGDNLLTWTNYPGLDPERGGSGTFLTYPQNKIYSFGINVQF